jgi:CBS domain-containing protein
MKAVTAKAATRSLLALTAADLMTTPVVTILHDTSLREAARLLHGRHISGAPVVDEEGRCLGVLSSTDFVTWASEGGEAPQQGKQVTCFIAPWGEMIDIEDSADEEIRQYMTAHPTVVAPATPIADLAQRIIEAHSHSVLVVEHDRPRGVVTSTDILAALAAGRRAIVENERSSS